MDQRIIYNDANGNVAVLIPTLEALILVNDDIKKIADKDVPRGLPYKIVDATDVPSERMARNAWEVLDSDLTDGVGSKSNKFEGV